MQEPGFGRAFLCLGCWFEGARAGWLMLCFAQIGAPPVTQIGVPSHAIFFRGFIRRRTPVVWSTLRIPCRVMSTSDHCEAAS